MIRSAIYISFFGLCFALCLSAQDTLQKAPSSFLVNINQDNAFGFNPAVFGSSGLNERLSLTFYGIFWTNPAFGNPLPGTDLWMETGIGLSFGAWSDRLILNPTLGFTHGRLLSQAAEGRLGEGIVPGLSAFFGDGRFEGEFLIAYYKSFRYEGPAAGDYLLYWALPGVRLSGHLSLGLHYESFVQTRIKTGDTGTLYRWLGAYLKFSPAERYSFRFSGGANTIDEGPYSPTFYKLSVSLGLL